MLHEEFADLMSSLMESQAKELTEANLVHKQHMTSLRDRHNDELMLAHSGGNIQSILNRHRKELEYAAKMNSACINTILVVHTRQRKLLEDRYHAIDMNSEELVHREIK